MLEIIVSGIFEIIQTGVIVLLYLTVKQHDNGIEQIYNILRRINIDTKQNKK